MTASMSLTEKSPPGTNRIARLSMSNSIIHIARQYDDSVLLPRQISYTRPVLNFLPSNYDKPVQFGRSYLKSVVINRGEPQKLGTAGALPTAPLGRVADPLKTSHLPIGVTTSNLVILRQRVYTEGNPQNWRALWPRPCGRGVAEWPLQVHHGSLSTCYHTKLRRSRSKRFGIRRGPKIFKDSRAPSHCDWAMADP